MGTGARVQWTRRRRATDLEGFGEDAFAGSVWCLSPAMWWLTGVGDLGEEGKKNKTDHAGTEKWFPLWG
jgi:hypothetical protein